MSTPKEIKPRYKSVWTLARGWAAIILPVILIIGIYAGYFFFPENIVFSIAWWLMWVGILPALVIGGYKYAVRGQELIDEEKAKKIRKKMKSD